MKISIAMATYNGEKYLQEQLDSFVAQARQPDELVVCDDGSSDATVEILRQFAASAPFEVKIHVNESNLGYAKNFEKAMSLCSGDIVFLSDQDDVWLENKLAEVEQAFLRNPDKMVVINDQLITDGELRDSGVTKLHNVRKLGLGDSWFVTGCCTALRKKWLDIIMPIPVGMDMHDAWVNRLADSVGVRLILESTLQLYRRHENNVSESVAVKSGNKTASVVSLWTMYGLRDARAGWERDIRNLGEYSKRIEERRPELEGWVAGETVDGFLVSMNEKRAALSRRVELASLPRRRRWPNVLSFWFTGGYRHLSGWKSAAKDLIRP
ncbi:glycosyltransferase family 2 protein [Marinobacter sp. HL-58]|uniref:glycosyltransferase family 2 protein n=1 Tax=Marinobacter sp. HL-58 TaxID=1479237 RepID=UPI00048521CA|nr:glycosyltransferase family 2 protein [Marinobacter sp. HL-58]KPP97787.1 MAG: Glycosyltransferases involved in cell wall biogenesis [Marinobacter sp. HL-58]